MTGVTRTYRETSTGLPVRTALRVGTRGICNTFIVTRASTPVLRRTRSTHTQRKFNVTLVSSAVHQNRRSTANLRGSMYNDVQTCRVCARARTCVRVTIPRNRRFNLDLYCSIFIRVSIRSNTHYILRSHIHRLLTYTHTYI